MDIYIYICIHIYTYIYIYIHMYIYTHCYPMQYTDIDCMQYTDRLHMYKNIIFELSWLPLARYSRSCSWACLLPCTCLAARSVSICFHYRMLAFMLRLDFPVSGGLVEDDHHARTLEDGVFCHLVQVAASVHVSFVYWRRHRRGRGGDRCSQRRS